MKKLSKTRHFVVQSLKVLGFTAAMALLAASGSRVFTENIQTFNNNRAIMAPHNDAVDEAEENWENAVTDWVNHMSEEEFNQLSQAIALLQGMDRDAFNERTDEQQGLFVDVFGSDSVTVGRALGNGNDRVDVFIDNTASGEYWRNTNSTGQSFSSNRDSIVDFLTEILNSATIGEQETDLVEFVQMRRGELDELRQNPPATEANSLWWFFARLSVMTASIVGGVKAFLGIKKGHQKFTKYEREYQEWLDNEALQQAELDLKDLTFSQRFAIATQDERNKMLTDLASQYEGCEGAKAHILCACGEVHIINGSTDEKNNEQ